MSTQRVRHLVSGRKLVTAALIGITLLAALAASTATGAINPLHVVNSTTTTTTTSTDTCGYDPTAAPNPKPPPSTVPFTENTVTRAIAFYGVGTSGHVGVFTNDETGLLIGAGGTPSSSVGSTIGALQTAIANGSSVSSIPVSPPGLKAAVSSGDTIVLGNSGTTESFTANAAAAKGATSISVTTKSATHAFAAGVNIADSSIVYGEAVPPTLGSGVDAQGRTIAPQLYLTDVTGTHSGDRGGDYEQGGTAANAGSPPFADALYGSWSPTVGTKPVNQNNWVLGPNADPIPATDAFGGTTTSYNEGYGSEVSWNVLHLMAWDATANNGAGGYVGLQPGHAYRAQSITHDADQYHTSGGGDVGEVCTTFTVPKYSPTISTQLSSSSITAGGSLHDSATLSNSTSDASGTVKYRWYSTLTACNAGTYATPGGTSIGDKTVASHLVADSDTAGPFNTAGTYYFRAFYSGDNKNNGASSACADETLVVSPKTPSISTQLSSSSITVGGSVHDSATLSNSTSDASGTAKYRWYSTLTACNAGTYATPGGTSIGDKTVASHLVADSDTAGPFNTAGTYYFRAFYSGDTNNNGASSACADETLVVSPKTPSISTQLSSSSITVGGSVHDSATLSNSTSDASGTVKYRWYSSLSDCQAGTYATPGGTSIGDKTVASHLVADSDTAGPFNTAGTYYFRAFYSGDTNNNGASSACADETLVVSPKTPSISTLLSSSSISAGGSVHDSATLSNSTSDASGTVKYRWYSTLTACNAGTYATPGGTSIGDKTVADGQVPDSDTAGPFTAGTYYFRAYYSGDNNNTGPVSSACADETLVVKAPAIQILKKADASSVNAGDQIGFTITVYNTGAGDAQGVRLTDTLPTNAGLSWSIDATGAGWGDPSSCAITAGVLSCGPATVPSGTTLANSTFTVHIVSGTSKDTGGTCEGTSGVVDNTGHVATSNDGSDQSEDKVCVEAPAIHIVKAADAVTVNAGDQIGFTMTVFNDGSGDAHGVKLSDTLPTTPGLSWSIAAQGTGWDGSCAIATGVLTCGGPNGVTVPAGTTQAESTFTVHIVSTTTGATGGDCPETGVVHNSGQRDHDQRRLRLVERLDLCSGAGRPRDHQVRARRRPRFWAPGTSPGRWWSRTSARPATPTSRSPTQCRPGTPTSPRRRRRGPAPVARS